MLRNIFILLVLLVCSSDMVFAAKTQIQTDQLGQCHDSCSQNYPYYAYCSYPSRCTCWNTIELAQSFLLTCVNNNPNDTENSGAGGTGIKPGGKPKEPAKPKF